MKDHKHERGGWINHNGSAEIRCTICGARAYIKPEDVGENIDWNKLYNHAYDKNLWDIPEYYEKYLELKQIIKLLANQI